MDKLCRRRGPPNAPGTSPTLLESNIIEILYARACLGFSTKCRNAAVVHDKCVSTIVWA